MQVHANRHKWSSCLHARRYTILSHATSKSGVLATCSNCEHYRRHQNENKVRRQVYANNPDVINTLVKLLLKRLCKLNRNRFRELQNPVFGPHNKTHLQLSTLHLLVITLLGCPRTSPSIPVSGYLIRAMPVPYGVP